MSSLTKSGIEKGKLDELKMTNPDIYQEKGLQPFHFSSSNVFLKDQGTLIEHSANSNKTKRVF